MLESMLKDSIKRLKYKLELSKKVKLEDKEIKALDENNLPEDIERIPVVKGYDYYRYINIYDNEEIKNEYIRLKTCKDVRTIKHCVVFLTVITTLLFMIIFFSL